MNETPAGRLLNHLVKEQQETNKLLRRINRHLWMYTSIVLLQITVTVITIVITINSVAKFTRLTQTQIPATAPASLIEQIREQQREISHHNTNATTTHNPPTLVKTD